MGNWPLTPTGNVGIPYKELFVSGGRTSGTWGLIINRKDTIPVSSTTGQISGEYLDCSISTASMYTVDAIKKCKGSYAHYTSVGADYSGTFDCDAGERIVQYTNSTGTFLVTVD